MQSFYYNLGNACMKCTSYVRKHVIAISMLCCSIFLIISLITFDTRDPSLDVLTSDSSRNTMSIPGSYVADIIIQLMGSSGFVIPMYLAIWGIQRICGRTYRMKHIRIIPTILTIPILGAILRDNSSILGFILNRYIQSDFIIHHQFLIYIALTICIILSIGIEDILSLVKYSIYYLYRIILSIFNYVLHIIQNFKYKCTAYIATKRHDTQTLSVDTKDTYPMEQHKSHTEVISAKEQEYDSKALMEMIEDSSPNDNDICKEHIEYDFDAILQEIDAPMHSTTPSILSQDNSDHAIEEDIKIEFTTPNLNLLARPPHEKVEYEDFRDKEIVSHTLKKVLRDFGVQGEIVAINPGPVVTLYELKPAPGTKTSRVIGLSDDIARTMSAASARISAISGRDAIGIELPNDERSSVMLRDILESEEYTNPNILLPIALGKDIGGYPSVVDIAKMPHLLVAGTTGSGKSVSINAMIISLLYRLTPEECRFIMIDPKMLELSVYDDIPHLLTPVVTHPKKAVYALKWVTKEMELRYKKMSALNVRNIHGYNEKIKSGNIQHSDQFIKIDKKPIPFIVVIIDEMADLMLVSGKEIEISIQRLAQMARAAGIHIITATQRPSVDVITGVIKANFPTRISFSVTSKIDSRTILGEQGAEQLLGMGDMLYMSPGGKIIRIHGAFVGDDEVSNIVQHLKSQGKPRYIDGIIPDEDDEDTGIISMPDSMNDEDLYRAAINIVHRDKKTSTSYIQRQLRIGYNRAANIVERMERENILTEPDISGRRSIIES